MGDDSPVMLKVQANELERKLWMDGDLLGGYDDRGYLEDSFGQIAAIGGEWTIYANGARILPDGARLWISLASTMLLRCKLVYEPSQLAMIVNHDDEYRHPASTFVDPWERPAPPPRRPLRVRISGR